MKFRLFSRKRTQISAWVEGVLLAVSCTVYAIIASLFTGTESSYFDEGFTSYLARFSPLEIAHYTALDVHPPLYYVVLHFWQQIVGINVFSLRFLSVLWGIVAIIFAFLIARRAFGRPAAWGSLLFVILSPLFIRYSEAMRMYTMAIAIISAATYLLIILKDPATRHRKLLWVIYALLVSAGMWTNYFTALIWAAHFTWIVSEPLLAASKSARRLASQFAKQWLWAICAAVVLYLPWLPWLFIRFTDVQSTGFWIKPVSIDTIVSTITTATVYRSSSFTVGWLAVTVVLYSCVTTYCIIRTYRQANPQQQLFLRLLLLCSSVPIIGLILLSLPPLRSSYVYRYVLNGVFMMSLVAGISIAMVKFSQYALTKKILLYSLSVAILLCGTIEAKIAGNRSLDTGVKNMVAQAVDRIHAAGDPGTPIVSRSPYTYYTASLYETSDYPVYYTFNRSLNSIGSTHMLYDHPGERGIINLAAFANKHQKIWIIAEDRPSVMRPPAPGWQRARSFTLYDPVTSVPTAYASQYVKP